MAFSPPIVPLARLARRLEVPRGEKGRPSLIGSCAPLSPRGRGAGVRGSRALMAWLHCPCNASGIPCSRSEVPLIRLGPSARSTFSLKGRREACCLSAPAHPSPLEGEGTGVRGAFSTRREIRWAGLLRPRLCIACPARAPLIRPGFAGPPSPSRGEGRVVRGAHLVVMARLRCPAGRPCGRRRRFDAEGVCVVSPHRVLGGIAPSSVSPFGRSTFSHEGRRVDRGSSAPSPPSPLEGEGTGVRERHGLMPGLRARHRARPCGRRRPFRPVR